jgi:anti-sigma regulatory factor (Ser/Thr protein kinase)
MKDVEAEAVHDMRCSAMVLHEAAAQLAEFHGSLPPEGIEHLVEILTRRSDMLVRLLEDLTTSHLAERGDVDLALQAVSLAELCSEVSRERRTGSGATVTVQIPADAVVVADPLRANQVVDNLVSNALRYGGPHVHVSAQRRGRVVELVVADDGHGIPDELQESLFEAYAHGSASHSLGGSGLGLAIVRELCDAMDGSIAYDRSGPGARFVVTLPALPTATTEGCEELRVPGHDALLWSTEAEFARRLAAYVADGITRGEAVLVATTPAHRALLEVGLEALGLDPARLAASGQYVPADAEVLRRELSVDGHVSREAFTRLLGPVIDRVERRWQKFRVYGDIVDLFWRADQGDLALELEGCWSALLARRAFPLLCGYQLTTRRDHAPIEACHDHTAAA